MLRLILALAFIFCPSTPKTRRKKDSLLPKIFTFNRSITDNLIEKNVVIATEGETFNRTSLSRELLKALADGYDPQTYPASINLEHWGSQKLGEVESLSVGPHPNIEGKFALLADLKFNVHYLSLLGEGKGHRFSIEIGKLGEAPYLSGLACTNDPASVGTDTITLSTKNKHGLAAFSQKWSLFGKNTGRTEPNGADGTDVEESTPEEADGGRRDFRRGPDAGLVESPPSRTELEAELEASKNRIGQLEKERDDMTKELFSGVSKTTRTGNLSGSATARMGRMAFAEELFHSFAESYGLRRNDKHSYSFSADPRATRKFLNDQVLHNNLLSRINVKTVSSKMGEKILASVPGRVMQRGRKAEYREDASRRCVTYETDWREFPFLLPWSTLDSWRGEDDSLKRFKKLWLERVADDTADLCLLGTSRKEPAESFEEIDFGFRAILERDNPENVFDHWVPNSFAILIGKGLEGPLSQAAVTDEGDGKVGLPVNGHGFQIGGFVTVRGTSNYNGEHLVLPDTTQSTLVIGADYVAETLTGDAVASQRPDFANLDALVSAAKAAIPQHKRKGLECWVSDSVLREEEQKAYSLIDGMMPSERANVTQLLSSFASLPSVNMINMPEGEICVSDPKNFSVYTLDESVRKDYKEVDTDRRGASMLIYQEQTNVVEDLQSTVWFKNVRLMPA